MEQLPAIKVPVLIPCVSALEIPSVPATRMNPDTQSTAQLVIAVRLDMIDWEQYAIRADSLLRGCVKALEVVK